MAAFCVGLTGGIASGKTTVSELFAARGAHVVDADVIAREVVTPGSPGLVAIIAEFGNSVLDASGALDRRRMRERVFADPIARHALEAIVHPRVRARMLEDCRLATSTYAIAAVPLLVEGGGRGAYPWLDRIVVVDVDTETQIARLVARDSIGSELATRMLVAQATRARRMAAADDVLVNMSTPDALRDGVAALDRRYRQLAAANPRAQS